MIQKGAKEGCKEKDIRREEEVKTGSKGRKSQQERERRREMEKKRKRM